MVRQETWMRAWAPPLALATAPLVVAALAVGLIPSHIGSQRTQRPSGDVVPFQQEAQSAADPTSTEPRETLFVAQQPDPAPRARGFSPVLEREQVQVQAPEHMQAPEHEEMPVDEPEPGASRPVESMAQRATSAAQAGTPRSLRRRGTRARPIVDEPDELDAPTAEAPAVQLDAPTD